MSCSSRLFARFGTAAAVTIAIVCGTGNLSTLAAPPGTTAPASSPVPTLPTDADIAVFYAPFGEKFDRATIADITSADQTSNVGFAYLNASNYRAAGAVFTIELAARPKFIDANFDRALCSEGLKKWDFAITDFTVVIARLPKFYDAYVERAHSYKMRGDVAKARADVAAAEAIHPERPDAYTIFDDPKPSKK